HVVLMALMAAVGLMSMFLVDLADLWFISMLGRLETTAGIGFAGTIAFANLSLGLGIGTAAGVLVAVNLGKGLRIRARQFATSTLLLNMSIAGVISLIALLFPDFLLGLLGAEGAALDEARTYLRIVALGFPLLAGLLIFGFALRAAGDARRAMFITLSIAIVNAILDPIFIFVFGLGIAGAALATLTAQAMGFIIGWIGLSRVHKLLGRPSFTQLKRDGGEIANIAVPVVLTQLATPALVAYMLLAAARFSTEVVAAATIINRLVPVFFGVVFSLSGAVGPVIGQNYGAGQFDRVRAAFNTGIVFAVGYTALMALVLFIFRHDVPGWFSATSEAARLIVLFCTWLAWAWVFTGMQFVAQAAFNNLGHARLSTAFNWGRVIIGTIVPAEILSRYYGADGLLIGAAIGSVIVGLAAALYARWLIARLA
ncbi:MAG TPA: MATE family efflux transporter, partial [Thermopetrobacter sp.]|nr:MATE family efflux transporter [Thermopetrobacter sp.]